jgi:hypothetical protein
MQRATLTVIEDRRGLVEQPALGQAVDLLPSERNGIGRLGDVLVRLARDARLAHRVDLVLRADGWAANAFGDRAVVDGEPIENAGWRMLRNGTRVGWPDLGITLRFEHVTAAPLERVVKVSPTLLLFDCAGVAAPGRWPCLVRPELARATAVLPGNGTLRVTDAADGVPLRVLCARARVLETDVAVHIAAAIARWFVRHAQDDVGPDEFVVTWDGVVAPLPAIFPRPRNSDGRGHIVETLTRLLPPDDPIVREDQRVQDLFHVMLDPYLGALDGREPQLGDVVTAAHASVVLEAAAAAMRPVSAHDLAGIARGLCPDAWRLEQQVREELALLDESSAAPLFG